MENEYKLSRVVVAILTLIISFIILIHEDISVKFFGMSLFTLAAFFASFPGTKVSKKMIETGDKISRLFLRILYYFAVLIVLLVFGCLLVLLFEYITNGISYSNELGIAAGQAMLTVLIGASFLIFLIIPYIQTLIVLVLRKIRKRK